MAKLLVNEFSEWETTPQEDEEGCILNDSQLVRIQNYLTRRMQEKVNLILDPDKLNEYARSAAFLDGAIEAYRTMIMEHKEAILARQVAASTQQ